MINIYTNMVLGSYRKVSQIGHNKIIIRYSLLENQNTMSMRLHTKKQSHLIHLSKK
jgi:hypothetical protein